MSHIDPQWSLRDGQREGWQIRAERSPKWIRVVFGGVTVADSKQVLVVTETGRLPVYYFPLEDVKTELIAWSEQRENQGNKGEAVYGDITVDNLVFERAAWQYPEPAGESSIIKGYISFAWKQADAWYEEEEQIFVHARDPYSRIDAIPSSRHVQVYIGGKLIADSRRPVILYETGLTPRYYLPKEDIRFDLLKPSATTTQCPYKGTATYWSALHEDGQTTKDIVWSYAEALPEVHEIAGRLSFYNEEVDAIYIDGVQWKLQEEDRLPYKNSASPF
ncbi:MULTISPECIES: DUF427 domain-containing protein [Bacillales]|uniref:DUF427 domain-containing protein n=1 Tax=Bacillales TaxID=1385 RepID=UPI0006A7AC16|nr:MULTISPECIES: DUF427 domain-containing protein [Bacillales]OBZ10068.1 hypothetical protein A7975_22140 [Bacillus sp. FJAT-26390]